MPPSSIAFWDGRVLSFVHGAGEVAGHFYERRFALDQRLGLGKKCQNRRSQRNLLTWRRQIRERHIKIIEPETECLLPRAFRREHQVSRREQDGFAMVRKR